MEDSNDQISNTQNSNSQHTLNGSFFNRFWPLIIDENICDIRKRDAKNFAPERPFDCYWSHEFLGTNKYGKYRKPFGSPWSKHQKPEQKPETEPAYIEVDDFHRPFGAPKIKTLEQQIWEGVVQQQHRDQVFAKFIRRKMPEYTKDPLEQDFTLTDDLCAEFVEPMELEILKNLNTYRCNFILIDISSYVGIQDVERWIKFRPFTNLIAVVRCEIMARQLTRLGDIFHAVYIQENLENSWQEELVRALEAGRQRAKELEFYENCSAPFIFIFSRRQYGPRCDTCKVMRRL